MKKRNADFKLKPPVLVRVSKLNRLLVKTLRKSKQKLRKKLEWLNKENKKQS
jgi:hypothetical protein